MSKSPYDSQSKRRCCLRNSQSNQLQIRHKIRVILGAATKAALIVQYVYLLSLFNVACCNYCSGISVVPYKVLLINIVIYKLSLLNSTHLFLVIQTGFLLYL